MAKPSILVFGDSPATADALRGALGKEAGIESMSGSLQSANGKAVDLIRRHDLMIFEADPDSEDSMAAVETLAAKRLPGHALIALTGDDVPFAKARRLTALGVDEVLPRGIDAEELAKAVRAHLKPARGQAGAASTGGRVVALAQTRGGIGATTLAVNLAAAATGKVRKGVPELKVVVLDLDLQFGNAGVLLDIEDNGAMTRMIQSGETPDATYLSGMVQAHPSGVHMITAPVTMMPLTALGPQVLGDLLELLRSQYDLVVIDLPRAMIDWIEPVLTGADSLILVTDTSVPCIRQIQRMRDFYREANMALSIDTVVMGETRPRFGSQHIREAEAALGAKLTNWIPRDERHMRKAADLGVPLVVQYPRSPAAKSIRALAKKLTGAPMAARLGSK